MEAREEKADVVIRMLEDKGGGSYYGEPVTQKEHMVQAAMFAEEESKGNADLIVAALLHDVGHLLHNETEDVAERGLDMKHEKIGAEWLRRMGFKESVCELVSLHVDAKRYLCFINPRYHDGLSDASKLSLSLQGGPMGEEEAKRFIESEFGRLSLQLRSWDEKAKVPDLPLPPLDHFRPFILSTLLETHSLM